MDTQAALLTIETSTSACSVALRVRSGQAYTRMQVGNNVHSKVVLPMVESVLNDAEIGIRELDAIGVSMGPGSFTGLRIGIGVAQGLAYGANLPIFGYSSLDILINQQSEPSAYPYILAALDARMNEMYWGLYENDTNSSKVPALFADSEIAVSQVQDISLGGIDPAAVLPLGNAWLEYPALAAHLELDANLLPILGDEQRLFPNATGLIALYDAEAASAPSALATRLMSPNQFRPLYVRNNVAAKPRFKQYGLVSED